ncbi:hypothetical protein [Taibaiella soli]|uniref:Uncharacterized protein n=1 Tax=Taibaiella soli TaxID=1649169 RepID=A0A2W2BKA5_9BACT|nr:hypothetical protein [Taibaiella soli]PZF73896.1 hypothetical protein DN068_06020 [Taibaiella soli]
MALDNLISVSFTPQELDQIDSALSTITKVMEDKAVNLTPDQRQQYGRVRYAMEVWIQKANSYMAQNTQLVPGFVDYEEHKKDLAAHNALNPRIDRMQTVLQMLLDTNLLLGTDLYNNSLAFYRSLKASTQSNAAGASAIYHDLKQQFPNTTLNRVAKEKDSNANS